MRTNKLITLAVIGALAFPIAANADFSYPKLPWYETYFFPIGTWNTPRTEPVPIDYYYNDPPGAIDLWTAPSYQSLLNFGLDAVHFGSYAKRKSRFML